MSEKPQRTTSPSFQFYPSDFLASAKVDEMSMTERGAYITLLARSWLDNGLPNDMKQLARYVRMKPAQFERMWKEGPLCQCFEEHGGKLVNMRQERERQKQSEFRRRQSDNGKLGGRPSHNPEKPKPFTEQTHSKARAREEKSRDVMGSNSEGEEELLRRARERWGRSAVRWLPEAPYDEWFVAFRDAYHRQGRADNPIVRDAFMAVFTRSMDSPEAVFARLLEAVRNHAGGSQWARGMVPTMLNWLEKGYYLQRHDPPVVEAPKVDPRIPSWAQ